MMCFWMDPDYLKKLIFRIFLFPSVQKILQKSNVQIDLQVMIHFQVYRWDQL